MAEVLGTALRTAERLAKRLVLTLGGGSGYALVALTADGTIGEYSPPVLLVTPDANRNLDFLAEVEVLGSAFLVANLDATYTATLRNSSASTVLALKPKEFGFFVYTASGWKFMQAQAGTLIASLLATANTWTAAQAFSAAVTSTSTITTTDGVGSGTARKIGGLVYNAITSGTVGPSQGTTELALQTYTIPASTIKAGTRIKGRAAVMVTAQAGATTVLIRARIGGVSGTVIVENPAGWDAAIGDMVIVDFEIVGRAAPGATASVASFGQISGKQAGASAHTTSVSTPYNLATNGSLDLVVTATMSASDATAVACVIYDVEVVG